MLGESQAECELGSFRVRIQISNPSILRLQSMLFSREKIIPYFPKVQTNNLLFTSFHWEKLNLYSFVKK